MIQNLPRSVITAGVILLALLAYFGVRSAVRSGSDQTPAAAEATAPAQDALPDVTVRAVTAQTHTVYVALKGRTQPDRSVTVRSETMGSVVNAELAEGALVERGAILCGLGLEARAARLAEAEAAVEANRVEYEAARDLAEKGWTSPNRAAAARAALDAAQAGLNAAKVEIRKTRLRAPFAGVFETRMAERGDFLSPGSPCGVVVDLDPVVVALDATEAQAGALAVGAAATIELADGRTRDGTVRYVARTASDVTRTFRVEVETPNPDNAVAAGLTAAVQIAVGEAPAVKLSPALLVLHDDGRVGVRHVDADDTIRFADLTIVDDAPDGVWVTGLPPSARILSAGQDFVREGVKVRPVSAEGL